MSASVVTVTPNLALQDASERFAFDNGTLTIGAGDYINGTGLIVDFTQACRSARPPVRVELWSQTTGNTYGFTIGSLKSNGYIRCFVAGVECSTAATPAGVTGDTIHYRIMRRKA